MQILDWISVFSFFGVKHIGYHFIPKIHICTPLVDCTVIKLQNCRFLVTYSMVWYSIHNKILREKFMEKNFNWY